MEGRSLLASCGWDQTVRLWDAATGEPVQVLEGHTDAVTVLSSVELKGKPMLASGDGLVGGGSIWLWNPLQGEGVRVGDRLGKVRAMCTLEVEGHLLLAVGGFGGMRLWDLAAGKVVRHLVGSGGEVCALCVAEVGGVARLVSAGADGTIRLWDPAATQQDPPAKYHPEVRDVCVIPETGHELLVCSGANGLVRDASTGAVVRELAGLGGNLCTVALDGHILIAESSERLWQVRLWDPQTGGTIRASPSHTDLHKVCTIELSGRTLLSTVLVDGTIWLWDPASGREIQRRRLRDWFRTPTRRRLLGPVQAVCAVHMNGQPFLASGGPGDWIQLWNLTTRAVTRTIESRSSVTALAVVDVDGRSLLASGGGDGAVQLWRPATGELAQVMAGHTSRVCALSVVEMRGHSLLASAGSDRTVRLWDLASGTPVLTIPVQGPASSLAVVGDVLIVGIERGIVSIALSPGLPGRTDGPLEALIGSAPGLSAATDLDTLRDEWER